MSGELFSPGELQHCLLCGVEYEPVREAHACEIESDWTGCYRDSWKGLIMPDAFAHPAKFSRSLIHRIYAHAKEEGWLAPTRITVSMDLMAALINETQKGKCRAIGADALVTDSGFILNVDSLPQPGETIERRATVIDPFGGVALGGLEAAWHGAHWVGCELEQRFIDLGRQNIALWEKRFGHMDTWGSVRLVQGDSRQLESVLREAGLCVSSPPFGKSLAGGSRHSGITPPHDSTGFTFQDYGNSTGNLGNLPATERGLEMVISSPPFANAQRGGGLANECDGKKIGRNCGYQNQGETDGQLGAMKDHGPSLAITSPPFADVTQANDPKYQSAGDRHGPRHNDYGGHYVCECGWHGFDKPNDGICPSCGSKGSIVRTACSCNGQLSAMVVSSPPYEGSVNACHDGDEARQRKAERFARGEFKYSRPDIFTSEKNIGAKAMWGSTYGRSEGQAGALTGDDFWTAARAIVQQTYSVLAPNSHAIWVLKGFIRKKTYVDFPDQWRLLCEACGFITLHWHRAWLVEPGEVQANMLGDDKDYTRERKSFFRRLAEKKGSPKINFEVVLCTLKP